MSFKSNNVTFTAFTTWNFCIKPIELNILFIHIRFPFMIIKWKYSYARKKEGGSTLWKVVKPTLWNSKNQEMSYLKREYRNLS